LKSTFDIQIAKKLKINNTGDQIFAIGFTFFIIFGLFVLPAKYLPLEIATIYLFEIVSKNVYIILSGSVILILIGEWLRSLRNYETAELELQTDRLVLITESSNIELKYKNIKKFKGVLGLFNGLNKISFRILMTDKNKYEIKAHSDVFDGLTDSFPDKV
jgi:hypothetical protein